MADADAPTLVQKLGAEFIGTFVLVFLGVGAVMASSGDYVAIGLTFGLAVLFMAYAFGRVSGGHFNPAVSVGAAIGGRISWKEVGPYVGAQVGGGLVGGLFLALILMAGDTGWEFGDPLGSNGFGDNGGVELFGALLVEIVATFIFLIVILAVTDKRNEHPVMAPLAIGLSLAALHFATIGFTGTSVNPARSLGVAFFSGGDAIAQLWLFIVAPLIGAALAGFAYPAIFGHGEPPVAGSGLNFGRPAGAGAVPGYGAPDAYQQQWNQQPVDQGYGQPAAGGYAAPQQGYAPPAEQQAAYAAPVEQQAVAPAQEQPIIQDGWQWDPQAQQWIPAQQQPPTGGESTQVRPPGS